MIFIIIEPYVTLFYVSVNVKTRSISQGEVGPAPPYCAIVSVPSYPQTKFVSRALFSSCLFIITMYLLHTHFVTDTQTVRTLDT